MRFVVFREAAPQRMPSKVAECAKKACKENVEAQQDATIGNDPEVMLTRFRGHCLAGMRRGFQSVGIRHYLTTPGILCKISPS